VNDADAPGGAHSGPLFLLRSGRISQPRGSTKDLFIVINLDALEKY